MSLPTTYRPSPLSIGSPRTSPFKRPSTPTSPFLRPSSPSSPSPAPNRPTTPTPSSPTKPTSPSKLSQNAPTSPSASGAWTPRGLTPSLPATTRDRDLSPTRSSSAATVIAANNIITTKQQQQPSASNGNNINKNNNALSKLPTSQVREMREAFQILDRDNDGLVTRDDVSDMLTKLALDASPRSTTPFSPHPLPLPTFLSTLSSLLAPLSSRTELLNAFAAFDDHDSGEIDVAELTDALLHTAPVEPEIGEKKKKKEGMGVSVGAREIEEALGGFVGKRAFGKGMRGNVGGVSGKGEVFRYREWVGGLMGGGEDKKDGGEVSL